MRDDLTDIAQPQDVLDLVKPATSLASKKSSPEAIDKTAHDFESVFLSQMLTPMWQGLETDTTFGGGSAEETYRSLLISEYGKIVSKSGGLGIAHAVKSELLKIQEQA